MQIGQDAECNATRAIGRGQGAKRQFHTLLAACDVHGVRRVGLEIVQLMPKKPVASRFAVGLQHLGLVIVHPNGNRFAGTGHDPQLGPLRMDGG